MHHLFAEDSDVFAPLDKDKGPHLSADTRNVSDSPLDGGLAAGPALLRACIATQRAGVISVIKTLRLVSKAASIIALQAVTGYTLQLGNALHASPDGFMGLSAMLGSCKLHRLDVSLPHNLGAELPSQEESKGESTVEGSVPFLVYRCILILWVWIQSKSLQSIPIVSGLFSQIAAQLLLGNNISLVLACSTAHAVATSCLMERCMTLEVFLHQVAT